MAVITYTAIDRGELIGGHSELTLYSFEVDLRAFNRSVKRNAKPIRSLSGSRRITNYYNTERGRSVETIPIDDATTLANMREFLSSVEGGEEFQIDIDGTLGSPVSPKDFELEGDYSETLVDLSGFYLFTFKAVEV